MARRKISEADDFAPPADAVDLPELTPMQEAFVQNLLAGKSACDAYRLAYPNQNMSNAALSVEACRLKGNPKVALWLAEARKAGLGAATLSLENHLRELERLKELALEFRNFGAAVQAEQLRGKASGHYVEQTVDVTVANDPERILQEIATLAPDLAEALAKQSGIRLAPKH